MPLPGTHVIPSGWDEHHRPVAEDAMTATGSVLRPSTEGVFDPDTMETTYPEPTVIYGPGRMRIVRDGVETTRQIGDRAVVIRSYVVTLPADAGSILVGDKVAVATASDPQLPDKALWVHDARYGSQVWERDLICQNAPPTTR